MRYVSERFERLADKWRKSAVDWFEQSCRGMLKVRFGP